MVNKRELEAFYDKIWRNVPYNSQEPNEDEQLHAQNILRIIKKYVLPSLERKLDLRILDLGCGRGMAY